MTGKAATLEMDLVYCAPSKQSGKRRKRFLLEWSLVSFTQALLLMIIFLTTLASAEKSQRTSHVPKHAASSATGFCLAQANPTKVQTPPPPPEVDAAGVIALGNLLAGGGRSRPIGGHTTIWDLLVEKAEGYMHSMLFCTLSRPDLRDGVSGIKPCEQSPLSLAIVENLVTLMDVPNATPEKRDEALNRMIQACNSLEQIGSQTCELENFKRVQDCFNKQQVLEQYFKLAGLDSLCGISGNQTETDLSAIFKTFWNNGGKECMNPKNFDRLSQDSLLCFELIKTHPNWELKEMTSCIADQFKKCGSSGARDAIMPLLEGVLRAYHDIRS